MKPKRPVRALILTSIRDVGACDLNGRWVPTKAGRRYMEGLIERAVSECKRGGQLVGLLEIAGVITDDFPANLEGSGYPIAPTPGMHWIHPLDLTDRCGERVCELAIHIPSSFRLVPAHDQACRREAKRHFEKLVLEHMREVGADIIISDHYMARIEYLIGEFGLYGKVVNIHPAVTDQRHECCFRGKTPTMDAISRARTGVPTVTGATLHLVNEEFDAGPIIESVWPTPVYADDSPEELRQRNYQMAKLPVFASGMRRYLTEVL